MLGLVSATASATQLALPVYESRMTIAPHATTDFTNLTRLGGQVTGTSALGLGLEWGLTVKGGAEAKRLFAGDVANPYFGGDFMLRFMGGIDAIFNIGVQAEVGYVHLFDASTINYPGRFVVTAGVPIVIGNSIIGFYLNPTIIFGDKSDADFAANKFWGSQYGLQSDIGFAFGFGVVSLFIQGTPRVRDWNDWKGTFDTDFAAGLAFGF